MASNSSQFVFKLLLFGFSLVFLGIILVVIASVFSDGSVNLGGIILVGPIRRQRKCLANDFDRDNFSNRMLNFVSSAGATETRRLEE
jgi:hypothetical protein